MLSTKEGSADLSPGIQCSDALLHEKSYRWVGFSPLFTVRVRSRPSFAAPFMCVAGRGKGWLLVVARVRLLVKVPCFCWQSACVTTLPHQQATWFILGIGTPMVVRWPSQAALNSGRVEGRLIQDLLPVLPVLPGSTGARPRRCFLPGAPPTSFRV